MATLNLKSFATLVSDQVAAIQSRSNKLLDFTIGSVLRSWVESNSAVGIWLQSVALQVLSVTRAATSAGTDLDSFVGDYGMTRLAGTVATGTVTFARFSPVISTLIPNGTTVETTDATQKFIVVADSGNGAYDSGQGGYVCASNAASVDVTVHSVNQATTANVIGGSITVLLQQIPGIDTVTNANPTTGGNDPETDAALRTRFRAFILSLSRATLAAIAYAIQSVQVGLYYKIVENLDYNTGLTHLGYFYVIADDGSGSPSSTLLNNIYTSIDAYRAASIMFEVHAPNLITATISLTITSATNYDHPTLVAAVKNAIVAYIDSIPIGQGLSYTKIYQIAYDTSPGVTNVASVLVNGSAADLACGSQSVIRTSSGSVSVS